MIRLGRVTCNECLWTWLDIWQSAVITAASQWDYFTQASLTSTINFVSSSTDLTLLLHQNRILNEFVSPYFIGVGNRGVGHRGTCRPPIFVEGGTISYIPCLRVAPSWSCPRLPVWRSMATSVVPPSNKRCKTFQVHKWKFSRNLWKLIRPSTGGRYHMKQTCR